jgi:hypothetical protein
VSPRDSGSCSGRAGHATDGVHRAYVRIPKNGIIPLGGIPDNQLIVNLSLRAQAASLADGSRQCQSHGNSGTCGTCSAPLSHY